MIATIESEAESRTETAVSPLRHVSEFESEDAVLMYGTLVLIFIRSIDFQFDFLAILLLPETYFGLNIINAQRSIRDSL
jgi:hypothetical protein